MNSENTSPLERKDVLSEETFRKALLDNLPQKIFLKDANSVYIACNASYARDRGIAPDAIAGKTDFDFSSRELASSYRADDKKVIESGEIMDIEEKCIEKGKEVFVHTVKVPIKNESGENIGVLGIFWDVTRRKAAETELEGARSALAAKVENRTALLKKTLKGLRESEKRYRSVVNTQQEMICRFLPDTTLLFVNQAYAKAFGSQPEKLIGRKFVELVPEHEREKILQNIASIRGPETPVINRHEVLLPGGGRAWHEWTNYAVSMDKGNATEFQAVGTDITAGKRAEEALRESESKFKTLFDNIASLIIIHDFEGRILETNNTALRALGYGRRNLLARNIQDIEIPEHSEKFGERMKKTQSGGAISFQSAYIKSDGTTIPVEVKAKTFRYGSAETVLSVSNDITERLEAERALEDGAEKLSRSLDKSVEALASASEKRDPYTSGHHFRVSQLAEAVAGEMGFSEPALHSLQISAKIHDIGKLYVPAEILDKPYKVSPAEFAIIMAHPSVGYDIVKKMDFPASVARTILQHHERLNGSGYPLHLSARDISLEAKILAVADVIEAMTAHRPYRTAHPIERALDEILRNVNILFDSEIVSVCLELFNSGKFSFRSPE